MGLWGSLLGRKPPPSPEEARRLLFDAAARGDPSLASLARDHEALVLARFREWQSVPKDVQQNPAAMNAYAQGLIGLATYFAEVRGHPELLRGLTGTSKDNPLSEWQHSLQEADERVTAGDDVGAASLLRSLLARMEGLSGTGVDEYLPKTLGRLAACYFRQGDMVAALEPMERALACCEQSCDDEGVRAYLSNLYELHRYAGEAEPAARCLERAADVRERLGDGALAARDRAQAAVVRRGEPLCRIMVDLGRVQVEVEDARPEGRLSFVFVRNRLSLPPCTAATAAGVARAQDGDWEGALDRFDHAAKADRYDPWPSYHSGITLLHARRYREAMEAFGRTETLAPGWYYCRADRWMAEQLADGALEHALFDLIRRLQDGPSSPKESLAAAQKALAQDQVGVLYLIAGDALQKLGRASEAAESYRSGLAIAEEPHVKTRLLTALGASLADRDEGIQLLREASTLKGSLVAAAIAVITLRARVSEH